MPGKPVVQHQESNWLGRLNLVLRYFLAFCPFPGFFAICAAGFLYPSALFCVLSQSPEVRRYGVIFPAKSTLPTVSKMHSICRRLVFALNS